MGKGLANAFLVTSREVFRGAAPIAKITTPGFLQFLLENNKPNVLSDYIDDGSGYLRNVKIRYRTRGVPGKTVTTDDCSIQVRPAYKEFTVPATQYRALGLTFSDDEMATFEKDALALVNVGTPTMTPIMKDIFEAIIEQANGLFADIDIDLLAIQAANFGKNIIKGDNTAKTINFPLSTTTNPLGAGMVDVMADAMANEIRLPGAAIVGSGLINNYYLQQRAIPMGEGNMSGVNTSMLAQPNFYFDPYAQAAWGANNFGLFERDAVQFVNTARFQGAKAGEKGSDWFFTLNLPVTDSLGQGNLGGFKFDVQLTYRTCPGEIVVAGGDPIAVGRGWNVIISSSYQLVNIPADSYDPADRLSGVNGTFRYTTTNV